MNSRTRGLTLLELTVVLAILAVVTSMAVASFTAVEESTRHDRTGELIERIERSIVGAIPSEAGADQATVVTFFGDTGRLPRAVGADPSTMLSELWLKPADFVDYRLRQVVTGDATDDANLDDLLIGSGWRGVYLKLSGSNTALFDGYGNPFSIGFVPDSFPTIKYRRFISSLESFGADNLDDPPVPPAGFARDIPASGPVRFFDGNNPAEFYPALNVTVTKNGGSLTGDTQVYLIVPDAVATNGYIVQKSTLNASDNTNTFVDVPIGYRLMRVVEGGRKFTFRFTVPRGGLASGLTLDLK